MTALTRSGSSFIIGSKFSIICFGVKTPSETLCGPGENIFAFTCLYILAPGPLYLGITADKYAFALVSFSMAVSKTTLSTPSMFINLLPSCSKANRSCDILAPSSVGTDPLPSILKLA